jgi:hypothetical protein
VSPPPWPCAAARRRGAPLRLPASHRRAPGSRSASLSPHRPVRRRLTPPPAGNRRAAPPLPRRRRRPLRARALPSAPHARPTHRPALAVGRLGRAAGVPRPAQAAAAALLAAEPAQCRGARHGRSRGRGRLELGLGSLTSGARLSAPPFLSFMFFFQLFRLVIHNCVEIHRKMRKMPNKFC